MARACSFCGDTGWAPCLRHLDGGAANECDCGGVTPFEGPCRCPAGMARIREVMLVYRDYEERRATDPDVALPVGEEQEQ